jgi:hypothetical protein
MIRSYVFIFIFKISRKFSELGNLLEINGHFSKLQPSVGPLSLRMDKNRGKLDANQRENLATIFGWFDTLK